MKQRLCSAWEKFLSDLRCGSLEEADNQQKYNNSKDNYKEYAC